MDGPAAHCFVKEKIFADRRLDKRLVTTFDLLARHPAGSLPRGLSSRTDLIGGYRLFNNPKVSSHAIIAAHRRKTLARLAGFRGRVLLIHDTTTLDFSGLNVDGLGPVGNGNGRGLYAHHSLLVAPESRQVLGLMNQIIHQGAALPEGGESRAQTRQRNNRSSQLWKRGVKDLPDLPAGVECTDVSDRGSDVTEYMSYEIAAGRPFIVRSQHNRRCVDETSGGDIEKLHTYLCGLAPAGKYRLTVGAEKGGTRSALMAVSFAKVQVLPPCQPRGDHGEDPLPVWGVRVWELPRPDGPGAQGPLLEWILLTNRPVPTMEAARGVAEDYACRWMVEDFHKAQKTGCGVEALQMTTRHGLDNAITLLSVLAVHVLMLRCLARDPQMRDAPARAHEDPLKVKLAARASRHADWKRMTVWEYYIAVARLGGYMLNPHKRPPGWIILWRGYMRLEDMCHGARLQVERCV